ncbi:helix-turn-helix transcriptional regulator, partial [Lachnospiraceae bacterium 62-26]
MDMVNITRIKDLREDSDIKQKELADALGISQRAYSHYENGTRKIPLDILVALAEYYGCSTDVSAKYSCGFPDPQVSPIIVVDRYLD